MSEDAPVAPSHERGGPPARKLLARPTQKIRVALASGAILFVGAWLAPDVGPTALSAPQERAAPLLEEQVQLRESRLPFRGVRDLPAHVHEQSVAVFISDSPAVAVSNDYFESAGRALPAGYGVSIANGFVLTHARALDGRSLARVVTADGAVLEARVAAYEPTTGLVMLQLPAGQRSVAVIAAESPGAGTLAVAVGPGLPERLNGVPPGLPERLNGVPPGLPERLDGVPSGDRRELTIPVFVTSAGPDVYTLGGSDGVRPGMPVYNLDGELLAIASGLDGEAFPVRDAATSMRARAAAGERFSSVGISLQDLRGLLTDAFGERGVLVNDVVDGGPADLAGVRGGDVVVAVGETAAATADSVARALNSVAVGAPITLHLMRAGRPQTVDVRPALAYEVAALARARTAAPLQAPEARALFSADVLERARIPATARVLSVNGRTVTSRAQTDRELRRGRGAVPLLVQSGNTRYFVAIGSAP